MMKQHCCHFQRSAAAVVVVAAVSKDGETHSSPRWPLAALAILALLFAVCLPLQSRGLFPFLLPLASASGVQSSCLLRLKVLVGFFPIALLCTGFASMFSFSTSE